MNVINNFIFDQIKQTYSFTNYIELSIITFVT